MRGGVSNCEAEQAVISSGYGAEVHDARTIRHAEYYACVNRRELETSRVKFSTLERICEEHNVAPDIIKIDIEGYEYEMMESSVEFLKTHRPRLWLELHVDALRERGKRPESVLEGLEAIGYVTAAGRRPVRGMMSQLSAAGVARAGLVAPR